MTITTHSRAYRALVTILADTRRSAGLTQQQVADRLGKPQSYMAKIEAGERRLDLVEFTRLATALDNDPVALLCRLLDDPGFAGEPVRPQPFP